MLEKRCFAAGHAWPYLHRSNKETTMGTRTVSLLLAICAAGVWAPAHAQNADTSVVKLPQDIVYKGLPGAPKHATLFGDSSHCTSPASNLSRARRSCPIGILIRFERSRSCLAHSTSQSASNGTRASSRPILQGRYIPNPRDRRIMRGRKTVK